MAESRNQDTDEPLLIDENPERLDEQHIHTTKTFGFLIHPNITSSSPINKVADVGAGSGAWLLDLAQSLPPTCRLVGFDLVDSAFPSQERRPANLSFKIQDMYRPFPAAELGIYDLVAARFTSSVASRAEWCCAIANLMTLLKPGGWIQWIDSCNFALYTSVAGTSRKACREIYAGLEPFREKVDPVIGLFMREPYNVNREKVFQDLGFIDVHEDVFSTDRVHDPELRLRDQGTRNIMECFLGCLEELTTVEGSGWSKGKIEKLREEAMKEIDHGVYHTLDQVCIIGRKAGST